jgi:hypothetical protein
MQFETVQHSIKLSEKLQASRNDFLKADNMYDEVYRNVQAARKSISLQRKLNHET